MGPIQSLQELLDFLRRRAGVIALGLMLGLLAGVYSAQRSTPVFEAAALLATRVDAVSEDALRDGGQSPGGAARLLQLVEQRLTARDTMLRLADEYDMFPRLPPQRRGQLMRESITLMPQAAVNTGFGSDGALASMIIMVRADRAEKAADMANDLARLVVQETGAGRTARARQTLTFVEEEQARLTAELEALEAEDQDYRARHADLIGFSVEIRRTELARLIDDIQDLRREISATEAELEGLEAQNTSPRRQVQLRDTLSVRRSELDRLIAERAEFEPFFQQVGEVERELSMMRERQARLQDRISDVSAQVASAAAALRLEADARSATFELVEEATPPPYASSRSKRMMVAIAMVAGTLAALIGAFAYELLRPALRSKGQVERELGMRPVLVLPELVLPSERRRMRLMWLGGLGLIGMAVLAILMLTPT